MHLLNFLNQKKKKKINILAMLNVKNFVPSIILAFSTCFFFYFFIKYPTSMILFSLILTLGFVLSLYFVVQHIISKKTLIFILTINVGFFVASIAYIHLIQVTSPIISLAETEKIEKITITLIEDATPIGNKYYKAKARISECKYKDYSSYSTKGYTSVFIPATFITQNYMGHSIISKKCNEVSMFCKGLNIEASGYFRKVKNLLNYDSFFIFEKDEIIFLGWENRLSFYRAHLRFSINRHLYGWGKAGYLLLALLTANKDFIPCEESLSFRKAGLSHVLALSGMHLAVVGLLSAYFASFLLNKKALKLLLIATSLIFLIFAGASPSLIRAFFMLSLIAIAKLLYIKVNLLGVLCFTFSFHLMIFPEDGLSLSFMLSYSALFGILIFGEAIFFLFNSFMPNILNKSISASLGATFFTTPILAFSIKQISLIGFISSCIISPLISIFLVIGIIFIFISLIFSSLYKVLGFLLNIFYDFIIQIIFFFANFPVLKIKENFCVFSFVPLIFSIFIICLYKHKKKQHSKMLEFFLVAL